MGQSFGYGRLTCAWFTDKHRIIFGATREYLEHPSDFLIAAYHRVELAAAGSVIEVDGIF